MTGNLAIFQTYSSCRVGFSVRIADGSRSKVTGLGTIKKSKNISIHSVLFVPNLDCNLLSVSKFDRDLNFTTKFFANSCVFQELALGKAIGSVEFY